MSSIQNLREQRNTAAKALNTLVNENDGDWGAELQAQYDNGVEDINSLDAQINRVQTALDLSAATDAQIDRQAQAANSSVDEATSSVERHNKLLNKWLRGGDNSLNADDWSFMNALSTTTDAEGGFTVSQNFQATLLDAMKAFGGMRQVANVMSVGDGRTMNWPTTDSSEELGEIVGQNQLRAEDDIIDFGQLAIEFFVYSSKAIRVPRELLQDSTINLEGHLIERLANRIARIQNAHFTTGDGSGKPRGIVTSATAGATAAAASLTFDDIINLMHSVDPVYRDNAILMFHDSTLLELKKIKDGDNRPLWLPGVGAGAPDTIYGVGYTVNQQMPLVGASNKSVIYGDMSKYLIADATGSEMFRFTDSAYTKLNQVGYLGMLRSGAGLVDVGGAIKAIEHSA